MKSTIVKRSIVIAGHKTSVSLEDEFWNDLKVIAGERDMKLSELFGFIDSQRRHSNLSSAIRLFVLHHYQRAAMDKRGTFVTASQHIASVVGGPQEAETPD